MQPGDREPSKAAGGTLPAVQRDAETPSDSQLHLAGIVGPAMDAIITVDESQCITLFNAAAERMFGYRADMVIGQPLEMLIPEHLRAAHGDHIRHFAQTGVTARSMGGLTPLTARRANGQEFPIEAAISQANVGGSQIFTAILRDVSSRVRAEQALEESEARLAGVVASAMDAIITIDEDQLITLFNAGAERMFGYRSDIVIGQPITMMLPERFRAEHGRHIQRFGETGVSTRHMGGLGALSARRANGQEFPIEASISQVEIGGRKLFTAIVRDITERKKAEEALQASQVILEEAQEIANMGNWSIDLSDWKMTWSKQSLRMLGVDPAKPASHYEQALMVVHPDDLDAVNAAVKAAADEGAPLEITYRIVWPNGSVHWLQTQGQRVLDPNGKPIRLSGVNQDITERKEAQDELARSISLLQTALESTPDGVVVLDNDGNVVLHNQKLLDIWELTSDMLLGHNMRELWPAVKELVADADDYWQRTVKLYGDPEASGFDILEFKDGRIYERYSQPQKLDSLTVGRLTSYRDITERLKSEQALRESQVFLEEAQEIGGIGNWAVDLPSWDAAWSKQQYRLLGLDPAVVTPSLEAFLAVVYAEDQARVQAWSDATLAEGKSDALDFRVVHPDGSIRWIHSTSELVVDEQGNPLRLRGVQQDITEVRQAADHQAKLEQQLRQAQKIEAIGTLAGGIAHDFNNVLYAISGYGELVRDTLPPDSQAYSDQQEVLKAAERAAGLVRQILTFSRKSESRRVPVSISIIAKEVGKMMRATLPSTIEIHNEIETPEALTLADPVELHQVLMNLCTNAGQAMAEKGGALTIGLREYEFEEHALSLSRGLAPGSYYLLTVSDTGTGIPKDNLDRIFEPFFTTKEVGEGTGLGLSIVHGIVTGIGGAITVYSEPGNGTTFHVYLPRAGEHAASEAVAQAKTGTERILFVDDEEALAKMGQHALEPLGYQVTTATSGTEALELFRAAPDDFDIVITDETMPKLKGSQMAKKLVAIRPGIPVILCTGFAQNVDPEKLPAGVRKVLYKPVSRAELTKAIREALAPPDA